jgi:hypothetical protein
MAWLKTATVFWRSTRRSPRISPCLSAAPRSKVSGLVKRRDETGISAPERSRKGLASIRSPLPPTQDRKPRKALFDRQGMDSGCGSVPTEPKDWLRGSETSFMTRHHGVQCKVCGQSVSTGIAGLSLPIPVGPVHCPYCRQERFYLEHDRIEFDTENGLPLTDPV